MTAHLLTAWNPYPSGQNLCLHTRQMLERCAHAPYKASLRQVTR